ncbi:MAG: molecular chaperone HtpG [Anaeroplasmataceae bacterium]
MAKKIKFKTETKRLLDLMINSIYTNKDIFLRELISNASDAIDKHHFLTLTDSNVTANDYEITIIPNEDDKTITISDNGIGFTYDQLVDNLGTIAKSGSKEFIEKLDEKNKDEVDIIGQFGVGFYSAFMVAKEIEVYTKSPLDEKAYIFRSEGLETYSIDETTKDTVGTTITIHLKDDTDDVKYSDYLKSYKLSELITKYSDYIRYPIKTYVTEWEPTEEKDENGNPKEVEVKKLKTINSMKPLWKKSKSEITEENLNTFYKEKFMDYQDPMMSMHFNVEGLINYNALLFIPKKSEFNLYNESYEKGLQLYTKGVFILDKCKDLIPDYLRFVKGLVDSSDLSLNISREMLQEDKTLKKIAQNLEKKILNELEKTLKNDRENYVKFFNEYGINIKYGAYENYGMKKDQLKDLILFKTLNKDEPITLKEYVEAMPEGQKDIYYASGKDKEAVNKLPQLDVVKKHNYDVLICDEHVDEFLLQLLANYDEKPFKSVNTGDLDLIDEEEAKKIDEIKEEKKDILEALKEALKDEVSDVIFSKRLTDNAVCLSSKNGVSIEMERVLAAQNQYGAKAEKVLEINPNHEVFKAIENIYTNTPDDIKKYANFLLDNALIVEGLPVNDNLEFSKTMCELLIKANK